MTTVAVQIRRDTAANWTSANPTPLAGQICWETDTHRMKVGDGATAWTSLGYFGEPGALSDGDKGDISVSSSGTVWTIDNDAVTYAKLQNISAASKLLGRGDGGSGDAQEITLGSGLTMSGTTLSASGGGGGGGWETVYKSADSTRNNTDTLASDPHLTIAVSSGDLIAYHGMVSFQTDYNEGIKFAFDGPSYSSAWLYYEGNYVRTSYAPYAMAGIIGNRSFTISGHIQFSASGNFVWQWAQNSAQAANTYMKAGSWIKWKKLN